jgi:predicted DNA-binding protein
MTRFELKLPDDRKAALDNLAQQNGLPASAVVRMAIDRAIEQPDTFRLRPASDGAAS